VRVKSGHRGDKYIEPLRAIFISAGVLQWKPIECTTHFARLR
jgi:hypothetical protein